MCGDNLIGRNRQGAVARTTCIALLVVSSGIPAAELLPDEQALRSWIEEMKDAERGPFQRIRWFCKDGSVLPPTPGACAEHGGGAQHGEWTDRVKRLRAAGYRIANILAAIDPREFAADPANLDALNQILFERFMMAADDGWIFRKARYYRGALQEEGERRGARRLLLKLADDPSWLTQRYLPFRTAVRMLEHGEETQSLTDVRQRAATLSDRDPGFMRLRNKIHAAPDHTDARAVREYAARHAGSNLAAEFAALAALIDAVYAGASAAQRVDTLAKQLSGPRAEQFARGAAVLGRATRAEAKLELTAQLMSELRLAAVEVTEPRLRLAITEASHALENDHFVAGTMLREQVATASRMRQLGWLRSSVNAAYGAGLISHRQVDELKRALDSIGPQASAGLDSYKATLDYLARVPGWASQWQRFHFEASMRRFLIIEPRAGLFLQDQLRASPLNLFGHVLDHLLQDANTLAGVHHELFGDPIGAGMRSLNPGLARGRLYLAAPQTMEGYDPAGIYLLAETVSDLPPVAGILTLGEGNPLSHVQLLARNLGIPNVAIDDGLLPRLQTRQGQPVVLAVSARGAVRIADPESLPERVLGESSNHPALLIRPDLDKLDLIRRELVPLGSLRAADSGRIVGPKAAQLGELRQHFPHSVADGLAIPFGPFRELLNQPFDDSGVSVFEWIRAQYRFLEAMPPDSEPRVTATETFRRQLHHWIENADPGPEFRARLRQAMNQVFGANGNYGVFVRSDTNVEDLPGFTGAGLNLTVPNVIGFGNVVAAISRVWASPFTQRAFAWRQMRMEQPEHVYPAVLLLRSVAVDKSGVLVTQDIDTGDRGWLSVAVNEGVGGAVDGQAAESLRVNVRTGEVRLLAQATATTRRVIDPQGGVDIRPVSGRDHVLTPEEIRTLVAFAGELPQRYPPVVDADGSVAPMDIEFGFRDGKLVLFQLRPFLESKQARVNEYLQSLDRDLRRLDAVRVDLDGIPGRHT